jgi:hypothetical protein
MDFAALGDPPVLGAGSVPYGRETVLGHRGDQRLAARPPVQTHTSIQLALHPSLGAAALSFRPLGRAAGPSHWLRVAKLGVAVA